MKNFFLEIFTWWSSQTLGTRIYTLLNGKFVGTDADGNKYYLNKKNGQNRWVIYNGQIDASKINADWHDWIHSRTNEIPKDEIKKNLLENKNILISAHGNSIRALCKYLFDLNKDEINSAIKQHLDPKTFVTSIAGTII